MLYAEALCPTASLTRTRMPLATLLGGIAATLLGPRAWVAALAGLLLELALALHHRNDGAAVLAWHVGVHGAFYWGGAAIGLLMRPAPRPNSVHDKHCATDGNVDATLDPNTADAECASDLSLAPGLAPAPTQTMPRGPAAPPTWWYVQCRSVALLALSLLVAWRLDDVLCVSDVPVGLARSLVLWLGGALLDLHVWAPSGDARSHWRYIACGAYAYAHLAHAYVAAGWLRALCCGSTLAVAALLLRLQARSTTRRANDWAGNNAAARHSAGARAGVGIAREMYRPV